MIIEFGMEKASQPSSDQLTFEGNDRKFPLKVFIFLATPLLSKVFNFLILTTMSDVSGVDSHARIEHS
jgi:hypothetical protein